MGGGRRFQCLSICALLITVAALLLISVGRYTSRAKRNRARSLLEYGQTALSWNPFRRPKRRIVIFISDNAENHQSSAIPLLRLAQLFASDGHAVTLVAGVPNPSVVSPRRSNSTWEETVVSFTDQYGIQLTALPPGPTYPTDAPYDTQRSYEALLWLRAREGQLDLAYFPVQGGLAFFPTLTRSQGIGLRTTALLLYGDDTNFLKRCNAGRSANDANSLESNILELRSIELADYIISTTPLIFKWIAGFGGHGLQLLGEVLVAPVLPDSSLPLEYASPDFISGSNNMKAREAWSSFHKSASFSFTASKAKSAVLPTVSIIMTTFNREHFLLDAIRSIINQDYPNIELIVVDDASDNPAALEELKRAESLLVLRNGWRLVRPPKNKYLGEARNFGRTFARGRILMFMDDDNLGEPSKGLVKRISTLSVLIFSFALALPYEVSIFWDVMYRTKADACSCLVSSFYTDQPPDSGIDAHLTANGTKTFRWLPIGPAAGIGALQNRFGDANFFIRAEVFDALGGFTPHRLPFEDWEFLSRFALEGYRLQAVSKPLFWKRELRESMMHTMDRGDKLRGSSRAFAPYLGLAKGLGPTLFVGRAFNEERTGLQEPLYASSKRDFSTIQGEYSWVYGFRTRGLKSQASSELRFDFESTLEEAAFRLGAVERRPVVLDRKSQTGLIVRDTSYVISRAWQSDEFGNATVAIKYGKSSDCDGYTMIRVLINENTVFERGVAMGDSKFVAVTGQIAIGWLVEFQVEALEMAGCHTVELDAKIGPAIGSM